MALTNLQLWNYLRNKYPTFHSITSEGTKALFTSEGYEQLAQYNQQALNEFFNLSLRVFLQKINVANVKDIFDDQDFGESYAMTRGGGITQRMAIPTVMPVSPAYRNLQNGDSPDQFVVRKPESSEQFYKQNFDYQSCITMPDDVMYKDMFIQEFGMSNYQAGIMKALADGYKLQKQTNKFAAIHAALNSVTFPLQDTQNFETADPVTDITAVNSADKSVAYASKYINFINLVNNIVDGMVYTPQTGAFNKAGFETTQDISRLKILCRPTLANGIKSISKLNSAEGMSLNIDTVKVPDFGGVITTLTASETYAAGTVYLANDSTPTYNEYKALTAAASTVTIAASLTGVVKTEIFDVFGAKVADAYYLAGGVASTGSGQNVTSYTTIYVPNKYRRTIDLDNDIIAVIADKGLIFENNQSVYMVEPARNARGRYTTFWASSPKNAILVDNYANMVVIRKASN